MMNSCNMKQIKGNKLINIISSIGNLGAQKEVFS